MEVTPSDEQWGEKGYTAHPGFRVYVVATHSQSKILMVCSSVCRMDAASMHLNS